MIKESLLLGKIFKMKKDLNCLTQKLITSKNLSHNLLKTKFILYLRMNGTGWAHINFFLKLTGLKNLHGLKILKLKMQRRKV